MKGAVGQNCPANQTGKEVGTAWTVEVAIEIQTFAATDDGQRAGNGHRPAPRFAAEAERIFSFVCGHRPAKSTLKKANPRGLSCFAVFKGPFAPVAFCISPFVFSLERGDTYARKF